MAGQRLGLRSDLVHTPFTTKPTASVTTSASHLIFYLLFLLIALKKEVAVDVAQVTEWLTKMLESLGPAPALHKNQASACTLSTWEVEAGGSEVQAHH